MKSDLVLNEWITKATSILVECIIFKVYKFNNLMVFDGELSISMTPPEKCIWSCCHLGFLTL